MTSIPCSDQSNMELRPERREYFHSGSTQILKDGGPSAFTAARPGTSGGGAAATGGGRVPGTARANAMKYANNLRRAYGPTIGMNDSAYAKKFVLLGGEKMARDDTVFTKEELIEMKKKEFAEMKRKEDAKRLAMGMDSSDGEKKKKKKKSELEAELGGDD